ncbi:U-box domain-containing protein 34-like [Miscanthus floridulus]|uniref:U-box domain-containing protein 34-like n=1 Tax=Miscanthus floridulus TaxID=154761 RepID=UPI0034583188
MASGGAPPTVAVAVRPGGSGSRLAARWVAAGLPDDGHATAIAVVHVLPELSYVPSPTGERVPVALVGREPAEAYARDRRARAEEALLPIRRLYCCGRANVTVETVVVEGDGVAEALLRYMHESGVRSLVLGSASFRWFRRVLSIPDVPGTVIQAMQNSCNVFVVSKRKLIMKLARYPQTSESNMNLRIESISHETFALSHRSLLFDNFANDEAQSDSVSQSLSSYSAFNVVPSSESSEQVASGSSGVNCAGTEGSKNYDSLSSLGEDPCPASNSSEECQSTDEVSKLRKELQETLVVYDKACVDLVNVKKKIHVLSIECSEEARKVEHALEWEEALKQMVSDEKAKQLEVINEVEQARKSFTREAYSRYKTEMATSMISQDKVQIVDAILSKSRSCRRYSKKDIELATDNFSEERKIGEGGYGNVYRCTLDHTEVAVKVIQEDSIDKTDEFLKEVEILSQLHHPNLILLLGFCPEIGCLVYEYLKNGSLEDQLFNMHDKYIRNPSPSEQQMQIQLMLLITKVETECLVKEKLDQSEAHELDYLNPPTEAAQRRRDCMR